MLFRSVTYRCPVASNLVFTWSAFQVTDDDPTSEDEKLELPVEQVILNLPTTAVDLERADLFIREGELPFGLIMFKLKLGFIGADIFSTHTVWVEVKQSEMYAVIRGKV